MNSRKERPQRPTILLTVIGFAMLASGPFVMDPASTPRDQWSWHGTVHQLLGAIGFTLMPVSCFVFWRRFRKDTLWRTFAGWTLAAGVIIVAAIVLMKIGQIEPVATNSISPWIGLLQRLALITYFAWIVAFAWRLGLLHEANVTPTAPGFPPSLE